MAEIEMPFGEVRSQLADVIRLAMKQPVRITRYGQPTGAVIVSEDMLALISQAADRSPPPG